MQRTKDKKGIYNFIYLYVFNFFLGSQNNDSFLGMPPRPNSYQPNHTNSMLRFARELRDGPQNKL
jgi:hypothetical protein